MNAVTKIAEMLDLRAHFGITKQQTMPPAIARVVNENLRAALDEVSREAAERTGPRDMTDTDFAVEVMQIALLGMDFWSSFAGFDEVNDILGYLSTEGNFLTVSVRQVVRAFDFILRGDSNISEGTLFDLGMAFKNREPLEPYACQEIVQVAMFGRVMYHD